MISYDNEISREFILGAKIEPLPGLDVLLSGQISNDRPEYTGSIRYNLSGIISFYTGYSISDFQAIGGGLSYKYIIEKERVIFLEAGYLKIMDTELTDELPLRFSLRYVY
jgi:hypothetical protein